MSHAGPKSGTSDWMENICFSEGKMCIQRGAPEVEMPRDDHHMPRDEEPTDGIDCISLGCFCGVKLTFRRLGLNCATLPLDWNRTRIGKVVEFLRTDFREFTTNLKGPTPVPNTNLSAFRGPGHSFWHDNLDDPEVHVKLQRRIDRFFQVCATSRRLLFVRALATSGELAMADELYAELLRKFGTGNAQVYLLVIVCLQDTKGPILSEKSPGLFIYQIGADAHDDADPAPFCEPVSWALNHLRVKSGSQAGQMPDAASLLESGVITPNNIGLSGMEGVASFDPSEWDDNGMFSVGSRVEAFYTGTWYRATVRVIMNRGCFWKVQCDVDPPGTLTTTHLLRPMTVVAQEAKHDKGKTFIRLNKRIDVAPKPRLTGSY